MFPLAVYILIWWFIPRHIHEPFVASGKFYHEYPICTSRLFHSWKLLDKWSILLRFRYQKISHPPFRRTTANSKSHKPTSPTWVDTFSELLVKISWFWKCRFNLIRISSLWFSQFSKHLFWIISNRESQNLMTHHIDFRSELGASKRAGVSRIRNLPREKNINKREKNRGKHY